MSQKKDRERKRQQIRQKSIEKAKRRKSNKAEQQKKSDYRKTLIESLQEENELLRAEVNSLRVQLTEARSTASRTSNNTAHGSVQSAVLSSKKLKAGFNKTAWEPPSEEPEEQVEEKPVEAGFNRAAWAPPNGNTEE